MNLLLSSYIDGNGRISWIINEYNTTYEKGKFVSDYDSEYNKDTIRNSFDNYEEKKFKDIEKIINRES